MSGAGAVISGGVGAGVGKLKVDLGSLQGQANSMANVSHGRTAAFQGTIGAYANFAGAANLQGAAYDAAKAFGQNVIVPYYQACIIFTEAVADGCNKLVSLYTSMVGEESLDQEELEAQIAAFDKTIESLKNSLEAAKRDESDVVSPSDINNLNLSLGFTQGQRQKVQEKLDKLIAFGGASAGVFEGANSLGDIASQGEGAIHSSLNAGNFNMPADMGWVATTQANWAAREQAIIDNYHAAVAKVQNGEELNPEGITAIDRYRTAYPGEPIDPSVLAAIDSYWITSNYRAAVSKVKRGKELTEQDVEAIEQYQGLHPEVQLSSAMQDAMAKSMDKTAARLQRENYRTTVEELYKQGKIDKEQYNQVKNMSDKDLDQFLKVVNQAMSNGGKILKEYRDALPSASLETLLENSVEEFFTTVLKNNATMIIAGINHSTKTWIAQKAMGAMTSAALSSLPEGAKGAIIDTIGKIAVPAVNAVDDVAASATSTTSYALSKAAGPLVTLGVSMLQAATSDDVTFGDALTQNIGGMVTSSLLSVGFVGLPVAISTLFAGGTAATALATAGAAIAGLPLLGSIALAAGGAVLFDMAYNKIDWVKDSTDWAADRIDDGVKWAGDKINDGIEAVSDGIGSMVDTVGSWFGA